MSVSQALWLIRNGKRAVVGSEDKAKKVLSELGLTEKEIDFRLETSKGIKALS